jgi:glutamate-1-semialdehyde aminotransferase
MVSSEAVANYPSPPIDRAWLTELTQRELRRFADGHPHSADLFARGQASLMNHGVLITPFHNMALMSPVTSEADVDWHTAAFQDAVSDLLAVPGS